MEINLDTRRVSLSVTEFANFTLIPDRTSTHTGAWRAQQGAEYHRQLHQQLAQQNPTAQFEVPIIGDLFHKGWLLTLTGRIDQLIPAPPSGRAVSPKPPFEASPPSSTLDTKTHSISPPTTLREIKTITAPSLPAPESDLRRLHPAHFIQVAAYRQLYAQQQKSHNNLAAELLLLEPHTGVTQILTLPPDDPLLSAQLERLVTFLNTRIAARDRHLHLPKRPAFEQLRDGQQDTQQNLRAALTQNLPILFSAPTGFGKTGMILELALDQFRAGNITRLIYLTGKSTGQNQVLQTLSRLTTPEGGARSPSAPLTPNSPSAPPPPNGAAAPSPSDYSLVTSRYSLLPLWHMRPKSEHCINTTFNCTPEHCPFIDGISTRWSESTLSRFTLYPDHPNDLATLRTAGASTRICPYEITRAALPFHDVWIGDYNYLFDPAANHIFTTQPGFNPADTLLVIDEAHNLPNRVADSHSFTLSARNAQATLEDLHHFLRNSPLTRLWQSLTQLLLSLTKSPQLDLPAEDDLTHLLNDLSLHIANTPLPTESFHPETTEQLYQIPALAAQLADTRFPKLLWSPRDTELHSTCLNPSRLIAETLAPFKTVILATATPASLTQGGARSPSAPFEANPHPNTGTPTNTPGAAAPSASSDYSLFSGLIAAAPVPALTPWRDHAYRVAIDTRVDTRLQHRHLHLQTTADTIAALRASAQNPIAVFLPSYAYAESIATALDQHHPELRSAIQPRTGDLSEREAWLDQNLLLSDALLLILGSTFSEAIDTLGDRITHALVVSPALPEVNPVQSAKLSEAERQLSRSDAFQQTYIIPGLQKINQALGRLVRAPNHRATVILQCQRFATPDYYRHLHPEYQTQTLITTDTDLQDFLSPQKT